MSASPEQAGVINHDPNEHGNVLAVAGSGKSWTMVERASHLVEVLRVAPYQIIAVMFNQSAAKEFSERLVSRLGRANSPDSVTFHKLGTLTLARLIKGGFAEKWEFDANTNSARYFATRVIEATCRKYGFQYPFIVADVFLGFVDRVKSDLLPPEQVWAEGEWDSKYSWFVDMYAHYEQVRAKRQIRFFSDLIYDPVRIMMDNPEAAEFIAGKYKHMILDEYQDICESQQALVRFVAGKQARVMVVGDDDQTIYVWRGAKPSYILSDFYRDFPGAKTYKLTRTRRYGHILSCASSYVITQNQNRADKLCVSHPDTPNTQVDIAFEDGEGAQILSIVEKSIAEGRKLNDIAILVRTYSRSGASQFAFLQRGIPFRLEGGEDASVLENRWVLSVLGWMELAAGWFANIPYAGDIDFGSIMSARQILDTPGIGLSRDSLDSLCRLVLANPTDMEGFVHFVRTGLAIQDGHLSEKILKKGKLWRKIRSLSSQADKIDASSLAEQLVMALDFKEAIYKQANSEDAAEEQWSLVEAFLSYVKSSKSSLVQFLSHIKDLKSFSDRAKKATDALLVTSIHRSKGLEWPVVIMIGLYQGGFPHKPRKALREDKEADRIEDERRLFYVGMTRATHHLWLLIPPDIGVEQWHRAGKTGCPPYMKYDPMIASQFVYETNLMLCKLMPLMIKKGIPGLKAADPEVYNEYLNELGITLRVEKLNIE